MMVRLRLCVGCNLIFRILKHAAQMCLYNLKRGAFSMHAHKKHVVLAVLSVAFALNVCIKRRRIFLWHVFIHATVNSTSE